MYSNGRMKNDRHILSVQQGMELQVNVTTDISSPDSVMYRTYCQTLQAMYGIIRQTEAFYEAHDVETLSDEQLDECLFPFSSNIIAFSGSRGVGKTRTMLSVSSFLNKPGRDREKDLDRMKLGEIRKVAEKRFVAVPPISPSVLEEKQNILFVTLMRLYRYADERLEEQAKRNHRLYSEQKDSLWRAFQDCYSGIIGLKQEKREYYGDLMEQQDLRDGLVLRRHFYRLVRTILGERDQNAFLVVQLDDADSQVKNGYEVLEDVRKYLQIPNLVILMSTDMDMLQNVIMQDYFRQFPDRKADATFQKELMKSCRKYIDKLIPPSYVIHLPALHQLLQSYTNIELEYLDENGKQIYPWAKNMDIQDTVLMEIYRKTGVVFVRPKNHIHYIVPTTFRGLNQLLFMLSRMETLPLLERNEENFASADRFTEALARRIELEDENLNQFADYFTENWVKVKVVSERDQHFLKTLSRENTKMYVQITVDYLYERYQNSTVLETRKKHFTQPFLDQLMLDLGQEHASQEDYYLLFSIRTVFTLNHHKMALRQKRDALRSFYQMREADSIDTPQYFAVDYDPEITFFPKTYLVNQQIRQLELGESETLRQQRKKCEESLEEYKKASDRAEFCEDNVLARTEDLDEAKNQALDLERTIKSLLKEVSVAEKNVQSRQNAAENAALQLKMIQLEMTGSTAEKDSQKHIELTQKYGKAALQKEDLERKTSRAYGQLSATNAKVKAEQERHRELVRQLPQMKKFVDEAKMDREEAYVEMSDCEDRYRKEEEKLQQMIRTINPNANPDDENAMVQPVFAVPDALKDRFEAMLTVSDSKTSYGMESMKRLFCACMVTDRGDESGREVSFMNFLTFLLRLGKQGVIGVQEPKVKYSQFQRKLYTVQECALMVACNWDVQDAVYNDMEWKHRYRELDVGFEHLYKALDDVLMRKINHGEIYEYHTGAFDDSENERKNGWGILQGYRMYSAESEYIVLPMINRDKLLKYEIFDLVEQEPITVPDEPADSVVDPKQPF